MVLVGIQSGGAEVARLMREQFPEAVYCEVKLTRPGTKQKGEGMMHRLLQRLPLWLCNLLRMAESRINEWRSKGKQPLRIGQIELSEEAADRLSSVSQGSQNAPRPVLLLVDDAIDTGATIDLARRQLERKYPNVDVRVAVITVTTAHPMREADYFLYHNRTLCRFPWSNDYRGAR